MKSLSTLKPSQPWHFALAAALPLTIVVAVAFVLRGSGDSRRSAAANMSAAVVSIEAYYYDQQTYAGATAKALRQIDAGLAPSVSVHDAGAVSYCLQSTVHGVTVSFVGPTRDELRLERIPSTQLVNGLCPARPAIPRLFNFRTHVIASLLSDCEYSVGSIAKPLYEPITASTVRQAAVQAKSVCDRDAALLKAVKSKDVRAAADAKLAVAYYRDAIAAFIAYFPGGYRQLVNHLFATAKEVGIRAFSRIDEERAVYGLAPV